MTDTNVHRIEGDHRSGTHDRWVRSCLTPGLQTCPLGLGYVTYHEPLKSGDA